MQLPLPVIGITTALLPFVVIALSMIVITVFVLLQILPREREPPLLTQVVLALSVLFGGSVLLLALLFVFIDTNGTTAWTMVLLGFNFMMMFPAGFWFVSQILFEDRKVRVSGWSWPVTLGVATTGSEVLMGILFAMAGADGHLSALGAFGLGLSSIWFYWSMAAIMLALVLWAPLSPVERSGSIALVLASALAPWVTAFPLVGGIAAAVVMSGLFLYIARVLLAHRASPSELGFLLALSGLLLAMAVAAVGLVVESGLDPSRIVFGSVMAVGMVGEMGYLVHRCYRGPGAPVVPLAVEAPGRSVGGSARPRESAAPDLPLSAR